MPIHFHCCRPFSNGDKKENRENVNLCLEVHRKIVVILSNVIPLDDKSGNLTHYIREYCIIRKIDVGNVC